MVAKAMTWDFQVLSRQPPHYNSSAMKPNSASDQMRLRGTEPGQCHMKTISNVKRKQTFISERVDPSDSNCATRGKQPCQLQLSSNSTGKKICMQSQFFIKAKFSSFCLVFHLQCCSIVFCKSAVFIRRHP